MCRTVTCLSRRSLPRPHDRRMNLAQYRQHVGASSVSASGRVVPVAAVKGILDDSTPDAAHWLPFPPAKLNPNARHHWKALLR